MKEETRGICMFAYNNEQLDYVQFAHIAAGYIKKNMKNNNTCLITDSGTYAWLKQSVDKDYHDFCFDEVVIDDVEHTHNPRRHFDSPWTEFNAQFSNSNKDDIIRLSPYDKTILIDTDYIIQNNFYDYIFDTDIPFAMHKTARYLEHQAPYMNEQTLNEVGIHHWWSTIVYFNKNHDEANVFFDIWKHVKEHWDYYALLYQFPPGLFRTDFCVSIAAHMLNGFNNENFVHDFLGQPLINMDQKDDLIEVKDLNDWIFLVHDRKEQWKNILTRLSDTNVHVMNKRSLARNAHQMINLISKETA
jgi:hypothetical protein